MPTSFSLSLELIYLMNWLLKNEKTHIKKLVGKAIENGFLNELEQIENYDNASVDINFLHNTILDFLIFLENTLLEKLNKEEMSITSKEKLKKTLQKINPHKIDMKTIWLSMQQTKSKTLQQEKNNSTNIENQLNQNDQLKRVLFAQLLKNWSPKKNDFSN